MTTSPIDPTRCGTTANYQRHYRLGEKPCSPCRLAHNNRNRKNTPRGRPPGMAPIDWVKCGTEANYQRHLRLGEKPCDKCRIANNRAHRERRKKQRGRREDWYAEHTYADE